MNPIILIADDEPTIRNLFQEVFSLEGFTVETAANGAEVIQLLGNTAGANRILLLDLQMPILDGWGVVRWLVEHPEVKLRTKIILMSAAEKLKQASSLEHDAEMAKPVGIDAMLDIIRPFFEEFQA